MKQLGLIGYPLESSSSPHYFQNKWKEEGIEGWEYTVFPMQELGNLREFAKANPSLVGFNITIPYKVEALPQMHWLSPEAQAIGAINAVGIKREGSQVYLHGYNTDGDGFIKSLPEDLLDKLISSKGHLKCLILGSNGGAAKAVTHVLKNFGCEVIQVSREEKKDAIKYQDINKDLVESITLIVNCTPLGMSPDNDSFPSFPFEYLDTRHYCYDLVYNPKDTSFLNQASDKGAHTLGGLAMLHAQAEAAWHIWQEKYVVSPKELELKE